LVEYFGRVGTISRSTAFPSARTVNATWMANIRTATGGIRSATRSPTSQARHMHSKTTASVGKSGTAAPLSFGCLHLRRRLRCGTGYVAYLVVPPLCPRGCPHPLGHVDGAPYSLAIDWRLTFAIFGMEGPWGWTCLCEVPLAPASCTHDSHLHPPVARVIPICTRQLHA
jgi:hypothetical protein